MAEGDQMGLPVPRGVDPSKPSIARVYDALLGGKDNYAVDRAFVERMCEVVPEAPASTRMHREWLVRGVRYLAAEAGVRQFLDLGAGLPIMENTHEVAQRYIPDARVVYVDNDPVVLAHGRALLVDNDYTAVVTADLRDPEGVLSHPQLRELIDFSQPVAVLLVGMLHHLHDDENPKGVVDAYMNETVPGSYLFMTHLCASGPEALELEKRFLQILGTGRFRTMEEMGRYFDGLDLLEPGLEFGPRWRPDRPVDDPLPIWQRLNAGGIARKP